MLQRGSILRPVSLVPPRARLFVLILVITFTLSVCLTAAAQNAAPAPAAEPATPPAPAAEPSATQAAPAAPAETAPETPATDSQPAATTAQPTAATEPATPQSKSTADVTEPGGITEEELRTMLVGKQLFLRGGYLDNGLTYNEHGTLIGHSPQGSYTLSGIEIERVHLSKHKVELEGARYGLHFLGAMPYEDPTAAVDRVKITPKKKVVKITVDRELVVKPKVAKDAKEKGGKFKPFGKQSPKSDTAKTAPAPSAAPPSTPATASDEATPQVTAADTEDAKKEMAAAPADERPADPNSVTTTISPAHAKQLLLEALGNVFAQPFDARMMDTMPDFWKLYYDAVAAKADYRPKDPAILRQSAVDKKAHLTSTFEPPSNQFAQDNGVAGMSLYHVVIGADGKPGEIAVARPIGFGLDESAVDSIRKATFEPATKDGKPVPVMLDLIVQFRIFSRRTAATVPEEAAEDKSTPILPGPYSAQHTPAPAGQSNP